MIQREQGNRYTNVPVLNENGLCVVPLSPKEKPTRFTPIGPKYRQCKTKKEDEDGPSGGGKKASEFEEEEEEDRKMTPSEHEMMELNEKIKALEAKIAKWEDEYDNCADEDYRKQLLDTIGKRTDTLNRLLDQKARVEQGQFFFFLNLKKIHQVFSFFSVTILFFKTITASSASASSSSSSQGSVLFL
jgi:hypothetical protein